MNTSIRFGAILAWRRALGGLLLAAVVLGGGATLPACSPKSGCPSTESLRAPVDSKGNLKTKGHAKSGLFPKDMERRMKKGSRK